MCIEAVWFWEPTALSNAVDRFSYGTQWATPLPGEEVVDVVICVFGPNTIRAPANSSLNYRGAFNYHA